MATLYNVIVDDVVWKTFENEKDAEDFRLSVAGKVQDVQVRSNEIVSQKATQ